MTIAGLTMPGTERSSRWLLFASLALNLFFIGAGGALLLQSLSAGSAAVQPTIDRSVGGRIERIAATLPREDGDKLRAAFQTNRQELDAANTAYRRLQDEVRGALRAQPFSEAALRAAMTDMQAARQEYDRRLQDFFARVAAEMSAAGRHKLADWRSRPAPTPSKGEAR
jgi:uncharacterized membrane protein